MASQPGNNNRAQPLQYSSLQELRDTATVRVQFTVAQLNQPSICNTLLQLHDKGKLALEDGAQDETAYIYLFRFVDAYLKMKKSSKLIKEDSNYVNTMITPKRVAEAMARLEELGTRLSAFYRDKEEAKSKETAQIEDKKTQEESSGNNKENEPQWLKSGFMTPKELSELLDKSVDKRVLIVDLRPRQDFDARRMHLSLLLKSRSGKEGHLLTSVSYINVPGDSLKTGVVTWHVQATLKTLDLRDALNAQRTASEAFSLRDTFDHVVLMDAASSNTAGDGALDIKLTAFSRALTDFDAGEKKLRNAPVVLDGGWQQWLAWYPMYCTTPTPVPTPTTPKPPPAVTPKPFVDPYSSSDDEAAAPTPIKAPDPLPSQPSPSTPPVVPRVDRTKKPSSVVKPPSDNNIASLPQPPPAAAATPGATIAKTTTTSEEDVNHDEKRHLSSSGSVVSSASSSSINLDDQATDHPAVEQPKQPPPNTVAKPAAPTPQQPPKMPSSGEPKFQPPNQQQQVYRPMSPMSEQFGRPIQTPFMKEHGAQASKVLNKVTGTYSYQPTTTTQVPPPPSSTSSAQPPELKFIPPKPPSSAKPAMIRPPQVSSPTSSSFASSLKRTQSNPNLAQMDQDGNLSDDLAKVSIAKQQLKPEKPPPQQLQQQPPPVVNRQAKPMAQSELLGRMRDLQPVYATVPPGLTGIRNMGNTCFMNSVLQCLSNTLAVRRYFLDSAAYRGDMNRENELGFGGEVADEFAVLMRALWEGHYKFIAPRRFLYLVGEFNEQFAATNEQQDAQEFLLFLLDGLHEDLNRARRRSTSRMLELDEEKLERMSDSKAAESVWDMHLAVNNSIVVDLFQGQFRSTVECLTCHKRSLKFEAFMYLTLPLPTSRCNLYDCLQMFLQPETMRGESQWKCPKCKQLRNAVKKIDIWKLPRVLIVHLKRFKYQGVWRDKINTMVDFPIDTLELGDYVGQKDGSEEGRRGRYDYRLFAVANHSGTMDGGHYTAMCHHSQLDRWFKYDDSEISEINKSSSSLKTPQAYILFYSLV